MGIGLNALEFLMVFSLVAFKVSFYVLLAYTIVRRIILGITVSAGLDLARIMDLVFSRSRCRRI